MSDFSASGVLEITSVNGAGAALQEDLDGTTVTVSGSNQLASNAGGDGGGPNPRRQLLDQSNTYLNTATDQLDENVTLNETRNDLLRELLDVQEVTAQQGGGNNFRPRPRNIGGGLAGGVALAASALAAGLASVDWATTVGDAIPDINPGDIVSSVALKASDIVGDVFPLAAGALVGSALPIGVSALVANALPVGAGDVLADALPIGAAALVASSLPISASAVVASTLPVGVGDVVDSALPVAVSALVASTLPIGVGALISSAFPLTKSDFVGSESDSGDGADSGRPSRLFDGATDPAETSSTGTELPGPLELLAAGGVGASLGGLSGLAGGIGGGGFAGATGGSATAASLGTLGAVGGGVLGTLYGTSELANIAQGGDGYGPAASLGQNLGQDFGQSFPGAGSAVQEAFTNNPVYDAGEAFGEELNFDEGDGDGPTIDVTVDNTTRVENNGRDNERDVERTIDRRLDEFKRGLERELGGI